MKISTLLAGATAVALLAGAAQAQDRVAIARGQLTNGPGSGFENSPGYVDQNTTLSTNQFEAESTNGNNGRSVWFARGTAANDNGTASASDGATFTIQGTVSTDCAYFSGDNNTETFDFGTLGIYASDDTGPASAFEMTGPANLTINTNLAGCNSNNSVTLSRTTADLQNPNSSGFDNTVFRDTLPYSVTARYTGSIYNNNVGSAPQAKTQVLATGATSSVENNGAWRSPMALDVQIPVQPLALLAGQYSGSFSVTLQAI